MNNNHKTLHAPGEIKPVSRIIHGGYAKRMTPSSFVKLLVDTLANSGHGETPAGNVNLGVKWRDFSLRLIYDYYKTWGIDATSYDNMYHHILGELKYDIHLPDLKLTITPKYNIQQMISWFSTGSLTNEDYMRNTLGVSAMYDPADWLDFTGGVEGFYDYYSYLYQAQYYTDAVGDSARNLFWNGRPEISFTNIALYLQGLYRAKWGMNVTLGGRFENHSQYGSEFAPRFGVTQILGDFHTKLLLSSAFRSPSIGSLSLPFDTLTRSNPQIKPEQTYVQELEAGYRLNKNMFLTANLFNIIMQKPILYIDEGNVWGYQNVNATVGSWGAEAEISLRHEKANVTVNYSFYSNAGKDLMSIISIDPSTGDTITHIPFNVPTDTSNKSFKAGPYLAAPQHKIGIMSNFKVWKGLVIAPSAVIQSTTYGFLHTRLDTTYDSIKTDSITYINSTQQIDSIGPTVLFNLFVTYEDLWVKGLNVSFGVYDIFNSRFPWILGLQWHGCFPSGQRAGVRDQGSLQFPH